MRVVVDGADRVQIGVQLRRTGLCDNGNHRKGEYPFTIQGSGDLVDALNSNQVKLDAIDRSQLSPDLQSLSKNELQERIKQVQARRSELQKKVEDLSKQRDAYIAAENKRLAAAGKGDAFDAKVAETLRAQAAKKGFSY